MMMQLFAYCMSDACIHACCSSWYLAYRRRIAVEVIQYSSPFSILGHGLARMCRRRLRANFSPDKFCTVLVFGPVGHGLFVMAGRALRESWQQQPLRSGRGPSFLQARVLRIRRWPQADFALRCSTSFLCSLLLLFSLSGIGHGLAMTLPRPLRITT